MKTLLLVSGSLRAQSRNSQILKLIKEEYSNVIHIEIFEAIADLPHFNPDLEFIPHEVLFKWRKALIDTDALLISTPEYAHAIPGSLKNALDWVVGSGELIDKKVGILYTSSSEPHFVKVQLIEILRTMSAKVNNDWCFKISSLEVTREIKLIIKNLII